MKRTRRWIAIASVAILSSIGVGSLVLAGYAAWLFSRLPGANELAEYRPPTSTRVFAWDGTLIGEFSNERRIFVPHERIPDRLQQAFLTAEDRNFYIHGGIDFIGLTRAFSRMPGDIMAGRRVEGASTITQQVSRNILLSNERSITRKISEAIIALRLESVLTKNEILELYLNEIWLGYRSFGVAAAAYNYFGKSLDQLTLAEMAYLAILPKGPDNYHPTRRTATAVARRNWLLGEMARLGRVPQAEAEAAMREPLRVQGAPRRAEYRDADYFVEETRLRARELLGPQVNEGGYYIRTTLDPRLQTTARIALMAGLERYDRRHGYRAAEHNVPVESDWQAEARRLLRKPAERPEWERAILLSSGGRFRTVDGEEGAVVGSDASWAGGRMRAGDLVFVEQTDGGWRLRQIPAVNGALVAIDPQTGRVLAMVGGYSFSLQNFNRATQAERQPGSAFKPFVYASALEHGVTPATIVMDAPVSYGGWSPQNYSRTFYGPSTLRRGLVYSRNVMTVRLADRTGMRNVRADAVRWGVVDDMPINLATSLGAAETTPFRITAAYAAFANGGRRINPHLIELVQDRNGEAVHRADRRTCAACNGDATPARSPRIRPLGAQVMHPITAYQITSMLEGVTQQGTAGAVRTLNRRHIAGKTGTTNEYRSAWFVGYTPNIVVGVFIGRDDNRPLGYGETGSQTAVPIFIEFMREALKDVPDEPFPVPANAEFRNVNGVNEAFRPGSLQAQIARGAGSAGALIRRRPTETTRPDMPRDGPIPYSEAWPDAVEPDAPVEPGDEPPPPPGQTPPPTPAVTPPPKAPEDLSGLY